MHHTCTHTNMCTHIHMHTHTHAHTYTCTHIHMHTYTHAHTYTCTHIHMHAIPRMCTLYQPSIYSKKYKCNVHVHTFGRSDYCFTSSYRASNIMVCFKLKLSYTTSHSKSPTQTRGSTNGHLRSNWDWGIEVVYSE